MGRLPKSYIKKYGISKAGWKAYKEDLNKAKVSKSTRKVSKVAKRRSYRRRGKVRRRRAGKKFPLSMLPSIVVPIGSMLAGTEGVHGGLVKAFQSGDAQFIANEVKNIVPYETIGYRGWGKPGWDWGILVRNIGLIVIGTVVHKLAGKTGVNRYLDKVPFIGKYLAI